MNKLGYLLAFLLGVGAGGTAMYFYVKDKERSRADEEIESVKEAWRQKEEKDRQEDAHPVKEAPTEKEEFVGTINKAGYTEYSSSPVKPKPKEEKPAEEKKDATSTITIIAPTEFGSREEEGYTPVTFLYFSDGVVTDELYIPVQDPELLIGDALDHFGEYENDAVYVRNDIMKVDYEILIDLRNYSDVEQNLPKVR